MKKIFTLVLFAAFSQVVFGQAQRLVLVEEFTQASCGPCASQNPGFNSLLAANSTNVVSIKYQVWWPGYDPMYEHNEADVDARVSYYGVNGVPHGISDGVDIVNDCGYYTGAPACLSQSDIDNAYAITSPLELNVSHYLSGDGDSVYITLDLEAMANITGTSIAHIVVIEREISFASPPGSNGEKDFYNVMKKMLPTSSGTTLPGTMNVGYTQTINAAWQLANVYDLNQIAVVAFVQNGSQAILQAAMSEAIPLDHDGAVNEINSVPDFQCSGTITPQIEIENTGANTINSALVEYSVDGGTASQYSYNGPLAPGGTANVTLPSITAATGSHILEVAIVQVNGNTDINPNNSSTTFAIVDNIGTPAPISQGFESGGTLPTGYFETNGDGGIGWLVYDGVGGYDASNQSAQLEFYNSPIGEQDELYVESVDLSTLGSAFLVFDYAYASYSGLYCDQLKVQASSNCGSSWTTLFDEECNSLETAGGNGSFTGYWTPDDDEWVTSTHSLAAFIGQSNVMIRFQGISGFGNNLYIDNINVVEFVGIDDASANNVFLSLYPNPASDLVTVEFANVSPTASIEVVNLLGQTVLVFNNLQSGTAGIATDNLASGIYEIRLIDGGHTVMQEKLSVQH